MKYLFTLTDEDIFKHPDFTSSGVYTPRITVKAIVMNSEGKLGFVTSTRSGLYLLAGGGAESNNLEQEIKRECDEELNVAVDVVRKIGTAQEYRNRECMEYKTTCFFAKVIGSLKDDTRTESEKEGGLSYKWFTKEDAIQMVKEQQKRVYTTDWPQRDSLGLYNVAFNAFRDGRFFMEHINSLSK